MPRFTRAQLEAFRDQPVPDLIGDDCRLLIVGINPGLWTAATQTHFCHPSNRFYPALRTAGLIDWGIDTAMGITPGQRQGFTAIGMGITNLVNRATARASELSADELEAGGRRLVDLAQRMSPSVIAIAGVTAYRTAFQRPGAVLGEQEEGIGPASSWVIPNPSGLNAHVTVADLAGWLRRLADIAGVGSGL